MVATSLLNTVPTKVAVELRNSITGLQQMKELLDSARNADRMFQGEGRYEADAVINKFGTSLKFFQVKENHYATIEKWRSFVQDKNIQIDFDALLSEIGKVPNPSEIYISSECFYDWFS